MVPLLKVVDTTTPIEKVHDALKKCKEFCEQNSLNDSETMKINIHPDGVNKISVVEYSSPEGTFTVKYNPTKNQATAVVNFMTGSFRSTVTEDGCKFKGDDPVYHKHWGIFHGAFCQQTNNG